MNIAIPHAAVAKEFPEKYKVFLWKTNCLKSIETASASKLR